MSINAESLVAVHTHTHTHTMNLIDEKRVEKFYSKNVVYFIIDFCLVNSC